MGRAKIKRGSTNIDMTAMCDVAFLLLSFFILTTKFKPAEAVDVTTPSSVASKAAPQKDAFTVSVDKLGRIFVDMTDEMKGDVGQQISTARQLNWTPEDIKYFKASTFVGAPLAQMPQFVRLPPEKLKNYTLVGIPADSANNELRDWINAAIQVYKDKGVKLNFLIKGDNLSKYPAFKSVIDAFKKNDVFKYQLITKPESIPPGSELEKNKYLQSQEAGD
ncbi:MAG: biopolymer transporter ExbD [Ginsengibacter sp.]